MRRRNLARLPEIREELERRREAIQADLSRLQIDLLDATRSQLLEGTIANHPADEASDIIVAERDLGRIRDLQEELWEVGEALERIHRETYGICGDCGTEIEPARLRALPLARRCFACQDYDDLRRAYAGRFWASALVRGSHLARGNYPSARG